MPLVSIVKGSKATLGNVGSESRRRSGVPGLRITLSAVDETTKGVLRQPLIIPVIVGEFSVTEESIWSDYSTVSAGDFSVPGAGGRKARTLRSTDLPVMTIDFDAPWLQDRSRGPAAVKRELRLILGTRSPFKLRARVIPDPGFDELKMNARITSMTRRLVPGQAASRYYDLSVAEWRDPSINQRAHKRSRGRSGEKLPTSHRLEDGDTLYKLSSHYYGFSGGWRAIAEENGIRRWGARDELLKMKRFKKGDKVKIPEKPQLKSIAGAIGTDAGEMIADELDD